MKTIFLVFVAAVFLITAVFGVLIWRQTIVFEKKALAAKQRKEEYLKQLQQEIDSQNKLIQQEMRMENQGSEHKTKDNLEISQKNK